MKARQLRTIGVGFFGLGAALAVGFVACGGASVDRALDDVAVDAAADASLAPVREAGLANDGESGPDGKTKDAMAVDAATDAGVDAPPEPLSERSVIHCFGPDSPRCSVPGETCCSNGAEKKCVRYESTEFPYYCVLVDVTCDEPADCEHGQCCARVTSYDGGLSKVRMGCFDNCVRRDDEQLTALGCRVDGDCPTGKCVTQVCQGITVRTCGGLPASAGCTP